MLAGQPERLAEAFALLDPSHRALLELSLRREVADPALAELLRTDVETVGRQRVEALESLGSMLDTTAAEVEEALIEQWRKEAEAEEPDAAEEPEGVEEPDLEPTEEPDPAAPPPVPATTVRPKLEGSSRSRRRGVWLGLAAGIALVVLLISLGGSDDEGDGPTRPADTQASTATATAPDDPPPPDDGTEPVDLAPVLGASGAGGTVRVVGSGGGQRLELRLRGLSDAGYTLWLYNSIGEARALASFRGTGPFVRARLPKNYLAFGFLDVSLEPNDGNSNHSGASVLRLPTKRLGAG